jgi:hypothetical protein
MHQMAYPMASDELLSLEMGRVMISVQRTALLAQRYSNRMRGVSSLLDFSIGQPDRWPTGQQIMATLTCFNNRNLRLASIVHG